MKRLALLAVVILQGCAVASPKYPLEQRVATEPGRVMYCETQSVHRECGYITKQQERELRKSVDELSRRMGGF